jgi:hypothetical protein
MPKKKDKSKIFNAKDAKQLKPFIDKAIKDKPTSKINFNVILPRVESNKVREEKEQMNNILTELKKDHDVNSFTDDKNIDNNTGLVKKPNKGGRPKGSTEVRRIKRISESLSAFDALLLKGLKAALKDKKTHHWSIKLFMSYRFGNPATTLELNNNITNELKEDINIPIIKFIDTNNNDTNK